MTAREQVEALIERGTWVDGYSAARLQQADGVVIYYVEIDPKLKPKQRRIWLFLCKNARYTSAEFDQHIDQANIRDWRFRLANG